MYKLNFGCGLDQPQGWLNTDKDDVGQPAHAVIDILSPQFDKVFPVNTYDVIVANHVFHMFSWDELNEHVLPKLHDRLKPGGVLRIIDFDPMIAFDNFKNQNADKLIIPDEVEKDLDGKFCKYLTWYSTRKSICTDTYMETLLLRYGFHDAEIVKYKKTTLGPKESTELDTRPEESWFVEAIK